MIAESHADLVGLSQPARCKKTSERVAFVVRAALSALLALAWIGASPASAQHRAADVCQNQGLPKASAVINVGTGTAKIVDGVAGKAVYVCGLSGTLSGTAPTVTFIAGAKVSTDCDTNPVTLSGTFSPTSGSQITPGSGTTLMTVPPGAQLCATTTGTGSSFQGVITFLQR